MSPVRAVRPPSGSGQISDARVRRPDSTSTSHCRVPRYILRVAGDIPFARLRARIAQVVPTFEETMASAPEELIEQGRSVALREALLRQMPARFEQLDQEIEHRIEEASAEDLDRWIKRVVTAYRADGIVED